MKVFVTGGAGFLGKRLVRRLLEQGHDVRALVRPGSDVGALRAAAAVQGGGDLRVVGGTLGRIEACADEIGGCDAVVHAAAAMNGGAPVLFLNNVVTMRQVAAVAARVAVPRFVLVSSLGVYGTGHLRAGDVLDEQCPLDPRPHLRDPYSYSKIEQERVAWAAHAQGQLPLVVVRPGVIYGPGKGCLSARVGLQIGGVMLRMGGGQQVPYTYVDNCADAIALAAARPGVEGQAFNVVDDDLPAARRILAQYRKEVKRLRTVPVPRWAIDPLSRLSEWYHRYSAGQLPAVLTPYKSSAQWKRLRYANAKAKAGLGWHPAVNFEEGLRRTCEWARQQLAPKASASSGQVAHDRAA